MGSWIKVEKDYEKGMPLFALYRPWSDEKQFDIRNLLDSKKTNIPEMKGESQGAETIITSQHLILQVQQFPQ